MLNGVNQQLTVDGLTALTVLKALGNEVRLNILEHLAKTPLNVSELANALELPHSTVNFHVRQLEDAGLLRTEHEPGTRGSQKRCFRRYGEVHVTLPGDGAQAQSNTVEVSMPIGHYRQLEALPTCGLASEIKLIGTLDNPRSFFDPERIHAQILWFRSGFVEYAFPNNLPHRSKALVLEFSAEICSEAPHFNPDWPSDITLWINGIEVGTWTSPGDLGGEPARFTPTWWQIDQSTHGFLKRWRITKQGAFIDGERLSSVKLEQLEIERSNHVTVRIGVKSAARHVGGLNLFGKRFGHYPQDLLLRLEYDYNA